MAYGRTGRGRYSIPAPNDRKQRLLSIVTAYPTWVLDIGGGEYCMMDSSGSLYWVTKDSRGGLTYSGITGSRIPKKVEGSVTQSNRISGIWAEDVLVDVAERHKTYGSPRQPIPNEGSRPVHNYYIDGLMGVQKQVFAWNYLRTQTDQGPAVRVLEDKTTSDTLVLRYEDPSTGRYQTKLRFAFDNSSKTMSGAIVGSESTFTAKAVRGTAEPVVDFGGWFWNTYVSGDPVESNFVFACSIWARLGEKALLKNLPVVPDPSESLGRVGYPRMASVKKNVPDLGEILLNSAKATKERSDDDLIAGVPAGGRSNSIKGASKAAQAVRKANSVPAASEEIQLW